MRLSVLSNSAAAGETIDATGLWVGAQGSGDLPGWQWIATANHGASVPASVNIGLSLSGQTLTLTKPDGTLQTVDLPSGGGTLTPSTTDVLI